MGQEMQRVECACGTCQSYCRNMPGWFRPGEAEQAAALLGLPLEEFFRRHLTVDYWTGDEAFVLRPATVAETPGEMAAYDPRGDACVFLTAEGRCGIHAAKPHECAVAHHDGSSDDFHAVHQATADAWRGSPQPAQLLGREPEVQRGDALDFLFGSFMRMARPEGL